MFVRKKGAEGSVLQELCHFVILMQDVSNIADSAYFVKSTPLRAFSVSFHIFQLCILCEINFSLTFQCTLLILGRYVTDILKMFMKKRNAEKIILTNLQHFELSRPLLLIFYFT